MKRSFIALTAVAPLLAAPAAMADTVFYGRIHNAMVNTDYTVTSSTTTPSTVTTNMNTKSWDLQNNASRIGVKGSEELGSGLTALYQWEAQIDTADGAATASNTGNFKNRLGYVGLQGDFGTVIAGRQWTAYYGAVDKTDIFNMPGFNDHYIGPFRIGDAVTYKSPTFNGITLTLSAMADGASAGDNASGLPSKGADATNVTFTYDNGPISLGLSVLDYSNTVTQSSTSNGAYTDRWGVGGKYKADRFALMAQYEKNKDYNSITKDDRKAWGVAAEAYFGANTLQFAYGKIDNTSSTAATAAENSDLRTWSLGFNHELSKRTTLFAGYEDTKDDGSTTAGAYGTRTKRFGVGLRHDF